MNSSYLIKNITLFSLLLLWLTNVCAQEIFHDAYTPLDEVHPYLTGQKVTRIWAPDEHLEKFKTLGSNSFLYRGNKLQAKVMLISSLKNEGPSDLSYLEFYNLYPRTGEKQTVEQLVFKPTYCALIQDSRNQNVANVRFQSVAPGTRHETGWQAVVTSWSLTYHISPDDVGSLSEIPSEIQENYLGDDNIFQITNPVVTQARDEALAGATHPLAMTQNIFNWVQANMSYLAEGAWDDAPTVIERGTGSCSEYTFVFIALARSAGLPARWVGATVLRGSPTEQGPFRDDTKHRWAQVYLPRIGWIHCNVQGGKWGYLPNHYIINTFSSGPSEYTGLRYDSYRYWGWKDSQGSTERDRYYLWYPGVTTIEDNSGTAAAMVEALRAVQIMTATSSAINPVTDIDKDGKQGLAEAIYILQKVSE